jgi:hypothetical protein
MKSVFVIWRDIKDGMWHTVAQLSRKDNIYQLNYTQGAAHPNFTAFPRMTNKAESYVSNTLFSFFQNRLLPLNRPEFKKMLDWSDLKMDSYDELEMLSISGGARKTDQYRIISKPQITDDSYKIRFFTSGISHLDDENICKIESLKSGDLLAFEVEDTNQYDNNAVLITTIDEEKVKVGYCPKYYNKDIRTILDINLFKDYLKVVKVNSDSPAHFRLLCEFATPWPNDFVSFNSTECLPFEKEVVPV